MIFNTGNEDVGTNNAKYKCIFNVVDSNDVTAHLPSTMSGYRKYGWVMSLPKGYEKCKEIVDAYNNMINISNDDDMLETVLNYVQKARYFYDLTGDTTHFDGLSSIKSGSCRVFANKYSVYYKDTEPKHSIKNYYDLCKKLLPEHMHTGNEWLDKYINFDTSDYIPMDEALRTMGEWYCQNVYTYNPYSTKDFIRDKITRTFSGRFQYDYDRASDDAKEERETRVNDYNSSHVGKEYLIENFETSKDYDLDLETFIGNYGDHAQYQCELLNDKCYSIKNACDDCSSFTLGVMYYATRGVMDAYDDIKIFDIGSSTLYDAKAGKPLYEALNAIGFEKIPVTKEMTIKDLQSGDLLVSSSHCEFYYKDGEKDTNFGWGSVKSVFPHDNFLIFKSTDNTFFEIKGFSNQEFGYIYRLMRGVN